MIRPVILLVFMQATNAWAGTVLVLGDSLSAAHNMPPEQGWVALLQQRLQRVADCQLSVVNASISGETTSGGLARLPQLIERYHPSIVILELGANDGLRGLSLGALRDNLKQMVALSMQAGARVLLLGMQIPSNYGRRYADAFAATYDQVVAEFSLPPAVFLLAGFATDLSLFQADGVHPKAQAQSLILANVWPPLSTLLRDCDLAPLQP